jgi:hypothetical protein
MREWRRIFGMRFELSVGLIPRRGIPATARSLRWEFVSEIVRAAAYDE